MGFAAAIYITASIVVSIYMHLRPLPRSLTSQLTLSFKRHALQPRCLRPPCQSRPHLSLFFLATLLLSFSRKHHLPSNILYNTPPSPVAEAIVQD